MIFHIIQGFAYIKKGPIAEYNKSPLLFEGNCKSRVILPGWTWMSYPRDFLKTLNKGKSCSLKFWSSRLHAQVKLGK